MIPHCNCILVTKNIICLCTFKTTSPSFTIFSQFIQEIFCNIFCLLKFWIIFCYFCFQTFVHCFLVILIIKNWGPLYSFIFKLFFFVVYFLSSRERIEKNNCEKQNFQQTKNHLNTKIMNFSTMTIWYDRKKVCVMMPPLLIMTLLLFILI